MLDGTTQGGEENKSAPAQRDVRVPGGLEGLNEAQAPQALQQTLGSPMQLMSPEGVGWKWSIAVAFVRVYPHCYHVMRMCSKGFEIRLTVW